MRQFIGSVFLLLLVSSAFAQSQIRGRILDEGQQPLAYANILLLVPEDSSLVQGNLSDEQGFYLLKDVQAGDYLLAHKLLGYQTQYQSLRIAAPPAILNQADIVMSPAVETLNEVMVTAQKPLFEHQLDRLVVNVQNSVTATGTNALEVLARSPGVRVDGIHQQISLNGSQGVMIQINGKRSRMSGDALIQLLQAMPADNIEKIELIATPPASYDAEGTAGIINIVLIKNLEEGTTGNYTLNAGYGERPKYGASLNLNLRKGKWYVYSDVSANSNYVQEDVSIIKAIRTDESLLQTYTFSNRPAYRGFYNARLGVDYNLRPQTTLGVLFSGYLSRWSLDADTRTRILNDGGLTEVSQLRSLERNDWRHSMLNLNFQHQFANKAKLTVDYDYLDYWNENPADYTDITMDGTDEIVRERSFLSRKVNPIHFQVGKIDYAHPLTSEWNLEVGIKASISDFANDNKVADWVNGTEVIVPAYTNLIQMDENIYAAYVSSDWKMGDKTSVKAGLRYEYTDVQLTGTAATLADRMYGRLFPSVFVSHNINDNNSVQLSYSERIQRPSLSVLAPAFFFFSPNTITTGNPRVRATLSRQFRAAYRYKSVMASLQMSQDRFPVFWGQLDIIAEENLTISQPQNMQQGYNAFFMLSFPIQFTKWWESRYEGGIAWQQQELAYEGEPLLQRNVFAGCNVVQTFNISKSFSLQIDGYLQSAYSYGLSSSPLQGSFNIGIRKEFTKAGSISLNWEDVFNLGSFWQTTYNRPELNLVFNQIYQQEGSIFRLTYAHHFGNKQVKKNRSRDGASADERNRVQ